VIWQLIANIGRRLIEWSDRHTDAYDRHIIDLYKEIWDA
jgi:hypothetical protein